MYEYECQECGERFEALVMGSRRPVCPACGGKDLQRIASSFAVTAAGPSRGSKATFSAGGCGSGGG